jgi:DNA-binding FrmR family transcriptional regulator
MSDNKDKQAAQGHFHDGHWHTHQEADGAHKQEAAGGHGHTHTHIPTKSVLNRLSRINGHLGAVRRMVEEGRDCPEVLIQLAAIRSAIDSVSKIILKDHLDHCIVDAVETGDTKAIEELNKAIEIMMK